MNSPFKSCAIVNSPNYRSAHQLSRDYKFSLYSADRHLRGIDIIAYQSHLSFNISSYLAVSHLAAFPIAKLSNHLKGTSL
jgi:hypothetical protein